MIGTPGVTVTELVVLVQPLGRPSATAPLKAFRVTVRLRVEGKGTICMPVRNPGSVRLYELLGEQEREPSADSSQQRMQALTEALRVHPGFPLVVNSQDRGTQPLSLRFSSNHRLLTRRADFQQAFAGHPESLRHLEEHYGVNFAFATALVSDGAFVASWTCWDHNVYVALRSPRALGLLGFKVKSAVVAVEGACQLQWTEGTPAIKARVSLGAEQKTLVAHSWGPVAHDLTAAADAAPAPRAATDRPAGAMGCIIA